MGVHASTYVDAVENHLLPPLFSLFLLVSSFLQEIARILFFRLAYVCRNFVFSITKFANPNAASFGLEFLLLLVTHRPRRSFHLFQLLRLTILQLTMKVQVSFAVLALEQRLFDSFFLALWLIVELDAELLLRHVRFSL